MPYSKRLKQTLSAIALLSGIYISSPTKVTAAGFLDYLQSTQETSSIIDASQEPTSLAGSFLAAQSAGANGDDQAAVENYKRAIELDPENLNLKQSLFMAMTTNGNILEAIDLLKLIPAENQTQNVNHVVVAANALKQKSWNQAITRIDRIKGADLDTMLAKLFGSWAYYGNRELDKAIERAEEITGPDWVQLITQYHMGLLFAASGKDKEAIVHLEKAISYKAVAAALTETYMHAVEALARAEAKSGNLEKAKRVTRDGLSLLPGNPGLAKLIQQLNEGAKVAPLITTAQGGASEIFFNVGSAISRQGGLPFAQSYLQIARFLMPENYEAQFALGKVFDRQKKYILANDLYEKVPETSAFYRLAQLEIGLNLDQLGQVPEAEKILQGLIDKNPKDFQTVLSLGGVFGKHENYQKAVTLYDNAIALIDAPKRRHWSLFYRRGIANERTKHWEKAEQDFKKALALSPDQPDVLNYLGYSWIDKGINLEEGLNMVKRAVNLKPNSGFIIDSLGWAYFKLGKFEEAVVELERARDLMPSDPVVNDHLGDAYWHTGRKLEAVFQWKHALSDKPTDEDKAKITKKLKSGLTH